MLGPRWERAARLAEAPPPEPAPPIPSLAFETFVPRGSARVDHGVVSTSASAQADTWPPRTPPRARTRIPPIAVASALVVVVVLVAVLALVA